VLLYTLAIAATVTLLCGLLPAIRASRDGLANTQREGARTQVSTRYRLQWLLVGAQVALSVTLLSGAGLLVRSLQELWRLDPGFEPAGVLTFRVSGAWAETADHARLTRRVDTMLETMRAMPGVVSASTAIFLPGIPTEYEGAWSLIEAQGDPTRRMSAESRVVSRDYFATLQIPLVDGELCQHQSRASEVLVNRAFAAHYLGDRRSPVGLHLSADAGARKPARIVGVVGDARERGLDRAPGPVVYGCSTAPNPTPYVLLRTRGDGTAIAGAVRAKLKEIEPFRAVYELAPLEERIGESFAQNRLRAAVLVFFSLTALVLSLVGLSGTLSYIINLRRREIGLRLALGALRRDIIRQFVLQGVRVAGLGCLCGLVLLVSVNSTLSGMLYGISAADPVALTSVVALVLAVSAAASLAPAVRAALVEPMRVLRDE
jgi:putative ABC transport system permease protein